MRPDRAESRGLTRLTRLPARSGWLVLLALTACLAALLPLGQGGGGPAASADGQRDGDSPPTGHHAPVPAAAMEPAAPVLDRAGWTATATATATATDPRAGGGRHRAAHVLDGDRGTAWRSTPSPAGTTDPPSLTIDMHATQVVSALVYRPDPASPHGRVGQYELHLSDDGRTWGEPVASGMLADDDAAKTLSFAAQGSRYVRLTALTEADGRGTWAATATEIDLLGDPGSPAAAVDLPRAGWTATASDEETAAADNRAANVLDGDGGTIWHSKWSGTPTPLPHSITIDMHTTQTVSALTYQPRRDGRNGRIGAYSVATSTDGVTFGAPVAAGTWANDDTVKSATFTQPVRARYVRLTATTEANGGGPWSSAAEIRLSGPGDPSRHGAWSPVIGFPLVPVATALLPDNKLLAWSAYAVDRFGGSNGYTQTAILDLTTGDVTQRRVDNTGHDMFCPGIAMLADGRILVTGGSNAERASIYDPATDSWSPTSDMHIPRGYQAMTLLPDGDAFVLGGSWSGGVGGKDAEVWSQPTGTWRELPGVPVAGTMTRDPGGAYRADNHQWFYATSDGRVLHAGPSSRLNWIDTAGDGAIAPAGTRADSADAMNGNAVSYDVGRLLTLGGATAYENVNATGRAYTLDVTGGGNPVVARTGDMASPRAFSNSVVLPDGSVAVFGGQTYPVPFSDATSVLTPEIWDPDSGEFAPMESMAVPRNYHSVANLLPDGRVFSGGGGLCGDCATNHSDGAIFTPPYLLNPDGTERSRPAITNTPPASAGHGDTITVRTDRRVTGFAMVRVGAATHSTDNDQRRVPLDFTRSSSAERYRVDIPDDPGVALPGRYLLFALDAEGVPSIAEEITLTAP